MSSVIVISKSTADAEILLFLYKKFTNYLEIVADAGANVIFSAIFFLGILLQTFLFLHFSKFYVLKSKILVIW